MWSTVNAGASTGWIFLSNLKNIRLMNTSGYSEDAWLLTPPMNFKLGQYYTIDIEASTTNAEHLLTLALADDPAQPTAVQFIVNQNDIEADHTISLSTDKQVTTYEFYFNPTGHYAPVAAKTAASAEDTPHYVAIHAGNNGIGANTFIYSLKVKEVAGKTTAIGTVEADSANGSVEVFDLAGRRIGTAASTALEGFDAGIYIVRIVKADGTATTSKIIKQF